MVILCIVCFDSWYVVECGRVNKFLLGPTCHGNICLFMNALDFVLE